MCFRDGNVQTSHRIKGRFTSVWSENLEFLWIPQKKMKMGTQNDMEQKEPRDPELSIAWFTIQNWLSVFSMLLLFTLCQALRGGQTKTRGDTQETCPLAVGSSLGVFT